MQAHCQSLKGDFALQCTFSSNTLESEAPSVAAGLLVKVIEVIKAAELGKDLILSERENGAVMIDMVLHDETQMVCNLNTPMMLCFIQLSKNINARGKHGSGGNSVPVFTSVLELLSPVVGTVFALHAEVDVGADAAVVERLDRANVIAHAQKDLRRLVLAQQP